MAEKRKDHKNRVLRTGESQRKDLTYMYRFNDINGKRRTIYASTLQELREKEQKVNDDITNGLNTFDNTKVFDWVKNCYAEKNNISVGTKRAYELSLETLKESDLGRMKISACKPTHVKQYILGLSNQGLSYSTIKLRLAIVKQGFTEAVRNDLIKQNPFNFNLSSCISVERNSKKSLSVSEQRDFLEFIKSDYDFKRYYDLIVILFETGLRASELLGLTMRDIDLNQRVIHITHKLSLDKDYRLSITPPKTNNGTRDVFISNEAYNALNNILSDRQCKIEPMIGGYSGFLFLTSNGTVRSSVNLSQRFQAMQSKYNVVKNKHIVITPHICRHTFTTRMVEKGVHPKVLQYLLGHADISMTMDVYAHMDGVVAVEKMKDALCE